MIYDLEFPKFEIVHIRRSLLSSLSLTEQFPLRVAGQQYGTR